MKYISNAFSLNMFEVGDLSFIRVKEITKRNLPTKNFVSAIGHEDTANVLSNILGRKIEYNRINLKLDKSKDILYVAQYIGPRLPEGATTLPEGAKFKFFEITIRNGCEKDCPGYDCDRCNFNTWTHGI